MIVIRPCNGYVASLAISSFHSGNKVTVRSGLSLKLPTRGENKSRGGGVSINGSSPIRLIHDEQGILIHREAVDSIFAESSKAQFRTSRSAITTAGLEQEDILTGRSNEGIIAFAAFNNVVALEESLSGRIHPIPIGAKEGFDEMGVDGILGNGITPLPIHFIFQGRHAARKDNISFLTTNQPVSILTTNKGGSSGGVSRRDEVVTVAAVHGVKFGTNFQEVILGSRRKRVLHCQAVSIKSIIGGINVKGAFGSTKGLGGIGGVDGDFSVAFSLIPFSPHQSDVTVGLTIKVIPFQLGCDDVSIGFGGSSLGAERNRGVDGVGTVDQPVGAGNGVGKSIGYGILATLGTGQHNRARVGKSRHGVRQEIGGRHGAGGSSAGEEISQTSLLGHGNSTGISGTGDGILFSQRSFFLGFQGLYQRIVGLNAGIRIEVRIRCNRGVSLDSGVEVRSFSCGFKLGLAILVVMLKSGETSGLKGGLHFGNGPVAAAVFLGFIHQPGFFNEILFGIKVG